MDGSSPRRLQVFGEKGGRHQRYLRVAESSMPSAFYGIERNRDIRILERRGQPNTLLVGNAWIGISVNDQERGAILAHIGNWTGEARLVEMFLYAAAEEP